MRRVCFSRFASVRDGSWRRLCCFGTRVYLLGSEVWPGDHERCAPQSDYHFAENFRWGCEDQAWRSDSQHKKLSQQVGRRHNDRHMDRVVLASELHHCDGLLRHRRNCEAVEIVITTHQNALKPAILSSRIKTFLRGGDTAPPRPLPKWGGGHPLPTRLLPRPWRLIPFSFSNVGISAIWTQSRTFGLFWRRSGCTTSTQLRPTLSTIHPSPHPSPLGASPSRRSVDLAPTALDLGAFGTSSPLFLFLMLASQRSELNWELVGSSEEEDLDAQLQRYHWAEGKDHFTATRNPPFRAPKSKFFIATRMH